MLDLLGTQTATGNGGTLALTVPGGTDHVVVQFQGSCSSVSVGGVALTQAANNDRVFYGDISGRSADSLAWTSAGNNLLAVFYFSALDLQELDSSAVLGPSANMTVDETQASPLTGSNVVACMVMGGNNADVPYNVLDALVASSNVANVVHGIIRAGPGAVDASVRIKATSTSAPAQVRASWAFFHEAQVDAIIEPSALGMEWGVVAPGPTIVVSEDVTNYQLAIGMEWGVVLPGPRVMPTGPRQVMLTGEGVKTPEMTEGGTEGQVLTFHEDAKPTWEDGGGALALDDLTDVDAAAPGDGDVLAWDDGDSAWVPVAPGTPDLSAAALDDIGDVTAPAPSDGDVLTWDTDHWENAAAAGGASALDDLTDVDAAAPADGDVLTWSDGDSAWINAAPASDISAARAWLTDDYRTEDYPASPNATYDDEFNDATGMSGVNNGLDARWNWRNQSTSSVAFTKAGWMTVSIPAASSGNLRILEITACADGTYETLVSTDSTVGDAGAGMCLVDAVNGDLYAFILYRTTGGSLVLQRWNSVTSWNANLATTAVTTSRIYLRVIKGGGAFTWWYSTDGIGWTRHYSANDVIGPTRIGLVVAETTNNGLTKGHFDYFRKVA